VIDSRLHATPHKKSNGFKSGNREGQATGPHFVINFLRSRILSPISRNTEVLRRTADVIIV
jgi:hypothetical protein